MMDRPLLLLFCLPALCAAQDYQPISAGMKRAFVAENGLGRVFSLSIDSISVVGSDTTYFNYFELDTIDSGSEICQGWGGPDCLRQDLPSWSGASMRRIGSMGIELQNIFGDTLSLDLDQALTDT